MWQKLANFILRNRFFILGIITLLTVFFGFYAITALNLDNKYGIVLPKNSETTENYKKFKELFGEDGGALVIGVETDSLYTERNFRFWKQLGDSILQFDGVESIISEATLFTIRNNKIENRFEVSRIFSDTTYSEKSIDSIRREIKNNPIYKGLLYSDSGNVSLMMVGVNEKYLTDKKKSKVVLDIEELCKSYESRLGKFHFAGLPHLRVVIAKRIQSEMYLFIGFSMLVTSALLYMFFRSFRVVGMCMTVVAVAVVWAMGSIAFMGYKLTILMALIPPLMIVIGIPNCIFILTKFHQEVKDHGNKVKALSRVIQKIGTATFLTNFTTAIGFLTFAFTNSEKLMEFGIAASINILMVFVLSICILPIFASFSKPPKARHLKHLDRKFATGLINFIINVTLKHRTKVYIVSGVVLIVSVIGLFKINATGNIAGDLPQNDQILLDIQFMEKHFGGSIPFEMMISYKEKGRLFKGSTLERLEKVQEMLKEDTLFSRSISPVDFVKLVNMAYYNNNPDQYKLISNRDKLRMKKYIDNFTVTNANGGGLSLKELLDTNTCTVRIRSQMKDLGSYEVAQKVANIRVMVDSILNPDKPQIERFFEKSKNNPAYFDSIFNQFTYVANGLHESLSRKTQVSESYFDSDQDLRKKYYNKPYFRDLLRKTIDKEYFDVTFTGTSVVASEGTKYLVNNLITSLLFAVACIGVLMSILFRSWRMVLISMVPNIIPLLFTGGIMGYFGIPLKPSTLLVFSIAFGISVDDTIHYLAKYRMELKTKTWDIQTCVTNAIRESGLGMFYTSIVLFCGFSVFLFSQFGGTKALGLLISITLLVAMITNLIVLPSLLLSLDKLITTKAFQEPYFDAYDEDSDIDWNGLELDESSKSSTNT
jgi:uncharacterized protein